MPKRTMKTNNIFSALRLAVLMASALTLAMAFALTPSQAIEDPLAFAPTSHQVIGSPLACGDIIPGPSCSSTPSTTPTISVIVCAHDGFQLKTDVYLKDSTPRPVLVLRGIRCGITYDPNTANYHLVVQERRQPEGQYNEPNFLYSADQDDGHALLEQIASPNFPWCNGRIYMEGGSAGGIVEYVAAPGAVTALRGIKAAFATGDILNYGLFNGGVLHRDVVARTTPAPTLPPSWRDYVNLPQWNNYLITSNDASRAHVAGLHKGGWFDLFGQGTLDSFSRLQAVEGNDPSLRQKVVIGPWSHGGNGTPAPGDGYLTFPNGTIAASKFSDYEAAWNKGVLYNDWADWNNTYALPAVKVYHMGAPSPTEWRTYTTWPPSPAYEFPLYFYHNGRPGPGNGSLFSGTPPPNSGQVAFTSNPSNPCPTRGGTNNLLSCAWPPPTPTPPAPPLSCGPYDQRPIEARDRSDVLVFTSSAGPAFIVGRIYADVWIQTDLPDVDVFVRMTDVFPDGHSMLMAQGIQRARYRNGACPQLLVPNQPTKVRVDLGSTALVLPSATPPNQHKLRVIISASAGPPGFGSLPLDPLYDINPQNGDEHVGTHPNITGSINVLFGGTHASALYIPVPSASATPQPDRRPNTTPCPSCCN
jgi:uncharacterized protein